MSAATEKPGEAIAASALPGIVIDDTEAKVVGDWKHSTYCRQLHRRGLSHRRQHGQRREDRDLHARRFRSRAATMCGSPIPTLANRADNVRVTVFHADGEDTVYVDETQVPPIDGRFVSLGKFRFEKDGAGYVLDHQ